MGRKKQKEGGLRDGMERGRERAEMEAKEVRHVCKL